MFIRGLFSYFGIDTLELEQVYLVMDTAIPLGIIVNELVSNSLKHAFPEGTDGEVRISLYRTDIST